MYMALVKWLVGFVKTQQRTRVVLNKLLLSKDFDGDDDDDDDVTDDEWNANVVVVVGAAVAGKMIVNVSFCRLNQMSVKRMPIINPIIKHKIFLYKGHNKPHFEDADDDGNGTHNGDVAPSNAVEDDGDEGVCLVTDLNLNIFLFVFLIKVLNVITALHNFCFLFFFI